MTITKEAHKRIYNNVIKSSSQLKVAAFICKEHKDSVFVVCHGDENGKVIVHDAFPMVFFDIIKKVIDNDGDTLRKSGIKNIYSVSCYGGLQKNYYYKGFFIKSSHTSDRIVNLSLSIHGNKYTADILLDNGKSNIA